MLDSSSLASGGSRIHGRGADILLPPPGPPGVVCSVLDPLIPPLFFLDVQARRGGWRTPSPHARSVPVSSSPLLLAAAVAGSPFPLLAVAGEDTPC